jgi:deoxyadenosine/deoxycytidine kinase
MKIFTQLWSLLLNTYDFFFGKRWYIIEGNIGCGKTTLIRQLKENPNLEVIEEPVDVWKTIKNEEGENILGLFYKNSKEYAYLFQTIVFKSRMMSIEQPQKKLIRFSERSIWTDKNIFSNSCYEMGVMNTIEKSTYDLWFEWLEQKVSRKPDGIFYLRAEPNVCLERVHTRDRAEESSVSLEYLTTIHNKHDDWLSERDSYNGIPIYVIDNTDEPSKALEQVCRVTKYNSKYYKIRNYILDKSYVYSKIAYEKLIQLKHMAVVKAMGLISKIRKRINL